MGGEEDKKRYSPQPRGHLWQDQGGQALPQSGHSLEGRMLRQKLQHWVPDVKSRLIGKDPDAGKDEGRRRGGHRGWDGWMASPTQWTWVWVNSGRWWRTGKPGVLQSMGLQRVGHDWATEQQQSDQAKAPVHTDMGVLSYKAVAFKNGSLGQVLNNHLTYPSPLLMLYPCTKRKSKKTRLTDLLDFQLVGERKKRSQIWPLLLLSVEIHSGKYQKFHRLRSDFLLW